MTCSFHPGENAPPRWEGSVGMLARKSRLCNIGLDARAVSVAGMVHCMLPYAQPIDPADFLQAFDHRPPELQGLQNLDLWRQLQQLAGSVRDGFDGDRNLRAPVFAPVIVL